MFGLMQDWQLLCHRIIDHAATYHAERQVISRSVEGPFHTTTYADVRKRALRVAQRLDKDGIKLGDRVATLAWNTWRHLEAWYGIMGIGAIYHTVNPRLFPDQIVWIINHAEDRVVMLDLTFVPLVEKLADKLPNVERYVIFTDAAHMPHTTLKNAVAYEDWIAEVDGDFAWKEFDENTAAGMCYTSGTTGNPKGVLYSHRSNVLHALMAAQGDAHGPFLARHHHAGGAAVSRQWLGPGALLADGRRPGHARPEARRRLGLRAAGPVRSPTRAAVPTVWLMLLHHLAANNLKLPYLRRVVIGGSACPRAMTQKFQDDLRRRGASRLGHDRDEPARHAGLAEAGICRAHRRSTARRADQTGPSAVRRRDEDHRRSTARNCRGTARPSAGSRCVGPAVARAYFQDDSDILDDEGFFDTGDVATIDRTATCRSPTAPRT